MYNDLLQEYQGSILTAAEEGVRQACRLVLFLIERDSASRNS